MRFLHTADIHAAYRQYGSVLREQDFYAMLAQITDIAIVQKVDAVIYAGDTWDSIKPSAEAVGFVQGEVSRLAAHGIPVLGIAGNHDACEDEWLSVCGIRSLHNQPWKSADGIVITGKHFRRPAVFVQEINEDRARVKADVYVVHQAFKELSNFCGDNLSAEEMAPMFREMGVVYVAMGDIHQFALGEYDGVKFCYPGSPERNSTDDTGLKSVSIVTIDPRTKAVTMDTAPTKPRRLVRLVVNTVEQIDNILKDVAGLNSDKPVVAIYYTPELREHIQKAEGTLKASDILFRTYAVGTTEDKEKVLQIAESFDRKDSAKLLAETVTAYFDLGTDENEMIQMLLEGQDMGTVVKNYIDKEPKQ